MLEAYLKKRDFKQTTEPTSGDKGVKNSFVVQWHEATRLHYDFRLEVGGVLKSWAVPKGPSLNPQDKRLAIMVEDHPLDYQFFEGTIPKGNYGAGEVLIWDSGTYQYLPQKNETIEQALDKGDLKFELKGKILKGSFALFKIKNAEKGNEWLMVKHKDKYATTEFNAEKPKDEKIKVNPEIVQGPLQPVKPMLASLASGYEQFNEHIFEKKYDGHRCIALINNGYVKLYSRNQIDITSKYDSIVADLKTLSLTMILDGEIISEDNGKENFQAVANGDSPFIKYVVYDILHLQDQQLFDFQLQKRQELLKTFFENNIFKKIQLSTVFDERIIVEKLSKENDWEGYMAKNKNSFYYPNRRSDDWIKIKNHQSIEAVICGFSEPQGDRIYFGSLALGIKENGKWKYLGNCGTGMNETKLKNIFKILNPLQTDKSPFEEKIKYKTKINWVKPQVVCEVKYSEYTDDRKLRHPVFLRIREDKTMQEVVIATQIPSTPLKAIKKIAKNAHKAMITNPDKIYWPEEHITKGDLIDYYQTMAQYILPFLYNHPLSLNRHPNGINQPNFFQKNMDVTHLPKWIKTIPIHSDTRDEVINYMLCNDVESLIYMVNLGCIEINAWLSTAEHLNHPEFILIDLDPGDIDFKNVVDVALEIRSFLSGYNLTSFIKTSGSTGLHIYIPTAAKYDFDISKQFAQWVATSVQQILPKITSVERAVKNRTKKIYIDFLQNRSAQTVAVPFCVRPKPGATVSFPLHWEQVTHSLKISDYHIFNVPDLVKKWKNPWQDILKPDFAVNLTTIL